MTVMIINVLKFVSSLFKVCFYFSLFYNICSLFSDGADGPSKFAQKQFNVQEKYSKRSQNTDLIIITEFLSVDRIIFLRIFNVTCRDCAPFDLSVRVGSIIKQRI